MNIKNYSTMNEEELKSLLLKLLYAIRSGDTTVYKELVSESLTCFEPETHGFNVDGLSFHMFLVKNLKMKTPFHIELVNPNIRIYGNTAYTAYTMLVSSIVDNVPKFDKVNETRIWNNEDGSWKMVHFHRSA